MGRVGQQHPPSHQLRLAQRHSLGHRRAPAGEPARYQPDNPLQVQDLPSFCPTALTPKTKCLVTQRATYEKLPVSIEANLQNSQFGREGITQQETGSSSYASLKAHHPLSPEPAQRSRPVPSKAPWQVTSLINTNSTQLNLMP